MIKQWYNNYRGILMTSFVNMMPVNCKYLCKHITMIGCFHLSWCFLTNIILLLKGKLTACIHLNVTLSSMDGQYFNVCKKYITIKFFPISSDFYSKDEKNIFPLSFVELKLLFIIVIMRISFREMRWVFRWTQWLWWPVYCCILWRNVLPENEWLACIYACRLLVKKETLLWLTFGWAT